MADQDTLRELLRRWGYAVVNRFGSYDEEGGEESILSKNRNLAPGTKENFLRQLVGRDGFDRRSFMAQNVRVEGMEILPGWACDPVRATNDADLPHERQAVVDIGIPDDLRWIDSAVASLERQSPLRAMILREQFCGTGTQQEKAARVQARYGGALSLRQYRYELARGLDWMRGRQAA